jgi:hypothetical protein
MSSGEWCLDRRSFRLLAIAADSGLPALILSGQDGLTTDSVADVGEEMVTALSGEFGGSLR